MSDSGEPSGGETKLRTKIQKKFRHHTDPDAKKQGNTSLSKSFDDSAQAPPAFPHPTRTKSASMDHTTETLYKLFFLLYQIRIPGSETSTPRFHQAASRSIRLRTFSFFQGSGSEQATEPPPVTAEEKAQFLHDVKKFFRREKRYWEEFYTGSRKSRKKLQTQRAWAQVFNEYLATNVTVGSAFVNLLEETKVRHYSEILEEFIQLQGEKCNTDNTSRSILTIERARILLNFLKTHVDDPYSVLTGIQATQQTVTTCIKRATPSDIPVSFDLSRYLVEVSTVRSDAELAKNVRVLSAKIRGVFNYIRQGTLVLVLLPSTEEECEELPSVIRHGGKVYPVSHTIWTAAQKLDDSLLGSQTPGGTRAIFARCAIKPTSDNFIGIWHNMEETEENITWCSVSRIYLVKENILSLALDPIKESSELRQAVLDHEQLVDQFFATQIQDSVLADLQAQFGISDEVFARMMRSRTLYVDEKNTLCLLKALDELLHNEDHQKVDALVQQLDAHRNQILKQIDSCRVFALSRETLLQTLREYQTPQFTEMFQSTVTRIHTECGSRLEMMRLSREKVLDGSRKKHITAWWLKETRRTVQTFLKELGYLYEAIPKDYTNQPPQNLALVQRNLELVRTVLDTSSRQHKALLDVIEQLKSRIYPRMSDLLYEFRAVMLYKLDKDVSEESISQFTLEKMKKDVEENKEKFESGEMRQVNDMVMDVEYLAMMEYLETHPEELVNHPHIVPISGLVKSSIVRLQNECTTVLELWGHQLTPQPKSPPQKSPGRTTPNTSEPSLKDPALSDPWSLDNHGRNTLHNACLQGGSLEVAKAVLELPGCDVNVQDFQGDTALHCLALRNIISAEEKQLQEQVVAKIVALNGDVDRANQNGETPLLLAVSNSQEYLACLLLASKADPMVQASDGQTVLDRVMERPSALIASYLAKYHRNLSNDIIIQCSRDKLVPVRLTGELNGSPTSPHSGSGNEDLKSDFLLEEDFSSEDEEDN